MKKIVCALFLLPVLLEGCRSHRPLAESSSLRDSVRIKTVVRTEYVPDTVFIEIPMESERVTVRDTASHLETSDARLNTEGSLYHSLRNKPQKRPFEVKTEVVYRDSIVYRDRTEAETRTVEVERGLTRWQKLQMKGFWIALLVLAVVFRKKVLSAFKLFA